MSLPRQHLPPLAHTSKVAPQENEPRLPTPASLNTDQDKLRRISSVFNKSNDEEKPEKRTNKEQTIKTVHEEEPTQERRQDNVNWEQIRHEVTMGDIPWFVGEWVLHPDGAPVFWLDFAMGVAILFLLIVVPVDLAFQWPAIRDVSRAADAIFFLNILTSFRTAYLECDEEGAEILIVDPNKTAWRYFTTWFGIDAMVVLPWDLLLQALDSVALVRTITLARLILRPARFARVTTRASNPFILLGRLLLYLFMLSHITACLWWGICHDNDPSSVLGGSGMAPPEHVMDAPLKSQYLYALFWSLQALNGVGINFDPRTDEEALLAMFINVASIFALAYIIGNVAHVIEAINISSGRWEKHMLELEEWTQHRGMPPKLRERVQRFHQAQLMESGGIDEWQLLHDLPEGLRQDVSRHQCHRLLNAAPVLSLMPIGFQESILTKLRPCVIAAGEYVMRQGDVGDRMYFVDKGSVQVYVNGKKCATLKSGACFGEAAILHKSTRSASVLASTTCHLYALAAADFETILQYNSKVERVVRLMAYVRANYQCCTRIKDAMGKVLLTAGITEFLLAKAIRNWTEKRLEAISQAAMMTNVARSTVANKTSPWMSEEHRNAELKKFSNTY